MSGVFFRELGIPAPGHYLGAGGGSHGAMTGRMLGKTKQVLVKEQPDAVRVYLGTHSTWAGALTAGNLMAVAMMNPHQAPDLTKQLEGC